MAADDLETIRAWRNHPNVRSSMFSTNEITREEHQAWFDRASADAARRLLLLERDDRAIGFVQFQVLGEGGIVEWGFYVAPRAQKGTGSLLSHHALRFAFQHAGFHKVCGRVLAFNEPSIAFHLKFGFLREGILREHHFDGSRYHDVFCFGLLKSAWHD
ncbi:UDP-4-amino-4,6-dideoxy-N-acetyl-beta-L-altrosamine N-acetyltransferase [Pelagerythrobacter rhizovicinus]|uniref:UDP-4-amino-4, 6-dideoxy-N-acetyl-beta-L-altrosamine N-acetyltransferase n=1 Tax=Pelagerythrobacter rhizovicinus TaxID=2268576 RepID=A0A4Q2KIR1_9SPHN|nr:UDP-4-amino-4,6-dideoxy-N-acetyl-beta-L-altrosamine N-acetyltransferase [Pelagerythrobacter rhizovicinus]